MTHSELRGKMRIKLKNCCWPGALHPGRFSFCFWPARGLMSVGLGPEQVMLLPTGMF